MPAYLAQRIRQVHDICQKQRHVEVRDDNAEVADVPVVKQSLKAVLNGNLTILIYFFLIVLVYWGGSVTPDQWLNRVDVAVINLDNIVGSLPVPVSIGDTVNR